MRFERKKETKEFFRKSIKNSLFLLIGLGLFLELISNGWEQLDGIAIVLAAGILLPHFDRD